MGWPAASDEMCAVPGLQRRRTLEPIVAVTEIGFSPGAGVPDLDVRWIHGSAAAKYNTDPDIQVHACDEHTYILRQNKAVHYEAPFMFLLFGSSRALLLVGHRKRGLIAGSQVWSYRYGRDRPPVAQPAQ